MGRAETCQELWAIIDANGYWQAMAKLRVELPGVCKQVTDAGRAAVVRITGWTLEGVRVWAEPEAPAAKPAPPPPAARPAVQKRLASSPAPVVSTPKRAAKAAPDRGAELTVLGDSDGQ